MAKKGNDKVKKFEFSKVGTILDGIAKKVPIQIKKDVIEKTFISTGVYIVDAALSGRLIGGGISTNRISAFAGESGCLHPDEKITIYNMKTKKMDHNTYIKGNDGNIRNIG